LDSDKVKTASYWLINPEHYKHHIQAQGIYKTFPFGRRQGKDIFLLVDLSRTLQAPQAQGIYRTFPIGQRQGKDIFLLVN
jgi:hypothetical protein